MDIWFKYLKVIECYSKMLFAPCKANRKTSIRQHFMVLTIERLTIDY